ncbi:SRPBCC family protein [Streptomyces indicus]|uniref:Polyketide cyclase / dehydrase and lipid transport n=1 Tax=Streptomyces indicus TaxID=417292 RepID=A0A1G9IAC4_9ACTN|nr:SRPBCC family protein [Streptomyces indicus]SDL22151.1 Polyketide cyclase / dehydrase and lipid transport [Streptomyces indicus]
MSTEEFTHTATVAAPAARIFEHLARPESYIGLSPLLVAVRDIAEAGGAVRYVAVERFRFGPLRWDNPIKVTMTFPEGERRIVSEVLSPGRVRLTATVDLTPEGTGTRVTETVRVTYPRPLRPFVIGQATKVQRHRLAELTRRMEAPTADENA